MNKIISGLVIILVLSVGNLIYRNIDVITDYLSNFFTKVEKIVFPKETEYKRNYKYNKFSNKEDYIPYFKEDLENIYYNFINSGYGSLTFYCPEEYENCKNDIKTLSQNKPLMSKINNYSNPFNSFYYLYTRFGYNNSITIIKINLYTDKEIKEINKELDDIMKELSLPKDITKNDLIKIKDYLIENITYDHEYIEENIDDPEVLPSPSTKASGALLLGKAVCSGYSDAFALILDRINIPNLKVSSEEHVWNLVYFDGKWLHADITWSDTDNSVDLENKYFLITTEELKNLDKKEHNFDSTFFIEAK